MQTLRCGECKGTCIINGNIDKVRALATDGTHLILPQAGAVDPNWFEEDEERRFRILILGLNPHGGNKPDWPLYEGEYKFVAQAEQPAIELKKRIESIRGLVGNYKTMRDFADEISQILAQIGKRSAFAYSNQILCRTRPEAGELDSAKVEPVYRICFSTRLIPLISVLVPDLVLVMGLRNDGSGWSQQYFLPLFREAQAKGLISASLVYVGIPQTSRPNNRNRAVEIVREHLVAKLATQKQVKRTRESETAAVRVGPKPSPRNSSAGLTLDTAVAIAERLKEILERLGLAVELRVRQSRVSLTAEGMRKQIIGIVPGRVTRVSCPWFSEALKPAGSIFYEWRNYKIVSLEQPSPKEIEKLCILGLRAGNFAV